MGIVKGLKGLNKVMDAPQHSSGDGVKARWAKLEDAESVKVRFLQELDPDSPTYNEKAGLGFIAVEHTNPKDYRRKALCTMEDQGKCYGCEQHRKDYKAVHDYTSMFLLMMARKILMLQFFHKVQVEKLLHQH
jgi:hypothetical protein